LAHTAVRVWSCSLVDETESQPRRCGGELIHPNTPTLTFTCLSKMTSRPMGIEFAVYILVVDVRYCLCSHTQTLNEVLCAMVMCSWRGESAISLCLRVFVPMFIHIHIVHSMAHQPPRPFLHAGCVACLYFLQGFHSSLRIIRPFICLASCSCVLSLSKVSAKWLLLSHNYFFCEPERYGPISYVSVFCSTNRSFTEVTL